MERDSAVLDYPNEISSPLNADHHTVCKFASPHDSNYANVKNVIRATISKIKTKYKATGIHTLALSRMSVSIV